MRGATMVAFQKTDWNDAYENGSNIANSEEIKSRWPVDAASFRASAKGDLDVSYGPEERAKYDLFLPSAEPKGLFVFVHGGYWQSTDISMWSHYAKGAVESGYAALIPDYTLCPEVTIDQITQMVAQAINHAASKIDGPIMLTGHSAGGHIVAELGTTQTHLDKKTTARLTNIVPISGLFDLRPLIHTKLNDALKLTIDSAEQNSPAFKMPLPHIRLTAWVGGNERHEFLRQNALIANIWHGLGILTDAVEEPDKHHFNVIDGLLDKESALMRTVLA
jgi:acetyl esterase/lipase